MDDAQESKEASLLPRLRAERLGRRRASGLLLLNVLAALYGSSTVAGKFASDVAPGLPASLSSLVRFSSALLVFLPALRNVFQGQIQNPKPDVAEGESLGVGCGASRLASHFRNQPPLKVGAELEGSLFAASILRNVRRWRSLQRRVSPLRLPSKHSTLPCNSMSRRKLHLRHNYAQRQLRNHGRLSSRHLLHAAC
jgi:hypothetical protein